MSLTTNRFLSVLLLVLVGFHANQSLANQSKDNKYDANNASNDSLQKQRIIALAPHIVESLYAIGAGQQIIATTAHADYPKAAEDILRL